MELNGSVLAYYKKKPEKNGIPLSRDEKKTLERDASIWTESRRCSLWSPRRSRTVSCW